VTRVTGQEANPPDPAATRVAKLFGFAEILSSPKIKNILLYRNSDLRYQTPSRAAWGAYHDRHDT